MVAELRRVLTKRGAHGFNDGHVIDHICDVFRLDCCTGLQASGQAAPHSMQHLPLRTRWHLAGGHPEHRLHQACLPLSHLAPAAAPLALPPEQTLLHFGIVLEPQLHFVNKFITRGQLQGMRDFGPKLRCTLSEVIDGKTGGTSRLGGLLCTRLAASGVLLPALTKPCPAAPSMPSLSSPTLQHLFSLDCLFAVTCAVCSPGAPQGNNFSSVQGAPAVWAVAGDLRIPQAWQSLHRCRRLFLP